MDITGFVSLGYFWLIGVAVLICFYRFLLIMLNVKFSMHIFLSEIRQRTTAQRNASTPMPATPKQGSPKSLAPVTASPNLQRDASALSGPLERTAVPSLQSNIPPRHPGSPATSVPGMGKQNT